MFVLSKEQFFRQMIASFFPINSYLCLIHDGYPYYLDKILIANQYRVISKSLDQLPFDWIGCSSSLGYIVSVRSADLFLQYYQSQSDYVFQFEPHKTIILFFEEPPMKTGVIKALVDASRVNASYLITVKHHVKCLNQFDRIFSNYSQQTTVKSLYDDQLWGYWKNNQNYFINKQFVSLSIRNWKPVFSKLKDSFKVGGRICKPYFYLSAKWLTYKGFTIKILEHVTKSWPVKYQLVSSANISSMGFANVAVASILNYSCDLELCATTSLMYTLYPGKHETVNTFQTICRTYIVPKPKLLPSETVLFLPFTWSSWTLSLVSLLAVSLLLMVQNKMVLYKIPFQGSALLHAIRILSQGCIPLNVPLLSFQILIAFWLLGSLILACYYSAGLTTTLTHPRYEKPLNTIEDMIETKTPIYALLNGRQGQEQIFKNTKYSGILDLINYGNSTQLQEPNVGTTAYLFNQKLAVMQIDFFDSSLHKYLKILDNCFGTYYPRLIFKSNSPYKKVFQWNIRKLWVSGILKHFVDEIIREDRQNQAGYFSNYVDSKEYYNIGFDNMIGAFWLLILGLGSSFLVFLVELIWKGTRVLPFLP